ncbi:hypothetical protein [Paraburkholderia terrae]|uniref:Uncharacterized protein n=1 Tax=Paraburkholderia terrae TaxID=311230 RepID=A0A2I8F3R1_9BURK|nr:hypothetical protein [Paraburkholderia terrae]AUT66302.1 hypothetical protein C2L65_41950 [Paraburkholderia terrae]
MIYFCTVVLGGVKNICPIELSQFAISDAIAPAKEPALLPSASPMYQPKALEPVLVTALAVAPILSGAVEFIPGFISMSPAIYVPMLVKMLDSTLMPTVT